MRPDDAHSFPIFVCIYYIAAVLLVIKYKLALATLYSRSYCFARLWTTGRTPRGRKDEHCQHSEKFVISTLHVSARKETKWIGCLDTIAH